MTCFTTRHIQRGVRATFFNSEGAKINDSLGPPSVRPPGYAPENGRNMQTDFVPTYAKWPPFTSNPRWTAVP